MTTRRRKRNRREYAVWLVLGAGAVVVLALLSIGM